MEIAPSVAVAGFQARIATERGAAVLMWGGPDRFATVPRGAQGPLERMVRSGGLETSAFAGDGTVVRRTYAASPDGYTALDLVDLSVETLLAQARAGATTLVSARIGPRATLRGAVRLGPNDCAGLRGGVKTIDLDARTLLPLRIVARRAGSRTETIRLTGLRVNPEFASGTFAPLRPRGRVFRDDQGFRRVGPSAAARNLPYVPRLPTALPAGFRRAVTGWAARSAITGPEGSIPRGRSLFAAVYARGWERIEITQRSAASGDWAGDPFAGECRPLTSRAVTVGGTAATYAFGPETGPHLYWREGPVLHTVSGPFPPEDLVSVAESLAPAATP